MNKIPEFILILASVILLNSCSSTQGPADILFEDSMDGNWQKNWFLDGEKAVLEHRDGGLAFITTASKKGKREDRAAFDSQHAVLWTKKEFSGDIRISYTFSKMADSSWQKLIYIQARGIGQKPYVEDIHAWRDLRKVASMNKYYTYMNLVSLSLRDQIRCKLYPIIDLKDNAIPCESLPRGVNKGLPNGGEFHVMIEKRKKLITMQIKDAKTGEFVVNHNWDFSELTEKRNPKFVEEGRIGIRLMGGHKILMRNFKVSQLN